MYLVDNRTEIDVLGRFQTNCLNIVQIGGITVNWVYSQFEASAYFTYENYTYYLSLDQPMEENSILSLIETLLP